ncbi:MAG: hypothetical protein D6757_05825 [Alphaproteobacteria bacterium]|nr:MAG: hypothetical protein D6757_05825 [Alphaproteobacteria bacterium]
MPADARRARRGGDDQDRQASARRPSAAQLRYLERGLGQPGGKLPLFDDEGQRIDPRTIRACLDAGWAEPWARNPIKPDWLVCRLTTTGRALLARRRGRVRRVRNSSSDTVKS